MNLFTAAFSKIFKSGNQQALNKIKPLIVEINNKEKSLSAIKDQEFKEKTYALKVDPGTLILFYGRNYLHRVTPVESKKGRILVTLNYNLEEGIELSDNAKKTFFGRKK